MWVYFRNKKSYDVEFGLLQSKAMPIRHLLTLRAAVYMSISKYLSVPKLVAGESWLEYVRRRDVLKCQSHGHHNHCTTLLSWLVTY